MSSCNELFQRKLALDLDRQQNDAELTRINQIRASRAVPSDDEFKAASADALKGMQDPANRAAARGRRCGLSRSHAGPSLQGLALKAKHLHFPPLWLRPTQACATAGLVKLWGSRSSFSGQPPGAPRILVRVRATFRQGDGLRRLESARRRQWPLARRTNRRRQQRRRRHKASSAVPEILCTVCHGQARAGGLR